MQRNRFFRQLINGGPLAPPLSSVTPFIVFSLPAVIHPALKADLNVAQFNTIFRGLMIFRRSWMGSIFTPFFHDSNTETPGGQ